MTEKRKEKRIIVDFFLEVFDAKTGNMVGHMVDLTSQGMHLVSNQEIPIDREFTMKMRLPGGMPVKPFIEFRAVSKWCKNVDNSIFFDTGFEIYDLDPAYASQIIDILNEHRPI